MMGHGLTARRKVVDSIAAQQSLLTGILNVCWYDNINERHTSLGNWTMSVHYFVLL